MYQDYYVNVIDTASRCNEWKLLLEVKYGLLRTVLVLVDATLVLDYGWVVRHLDVISSGTERDRLTEVIAGLDKSIESALGTGVYPGETILLERI